LTHKTPLGTLASLVLTQSTETSLIDLGIHFEPDSKTRNCINSSHETKIDFPFPLCPRNYVVQHVLKQKIPYANARLASLFEGKYIYLSKQKVSSNVVQRCIEFFPDDAKAVIVHEFLLLRGSHFEQLVTDPYANYVINTALNNTRVSMQYHLFKPFGMCNIAFVILKYFSLHGRAICSMPLLKRSALMRMPSEPTPAVRGSAGSCPGGESCTICVPLVPGVRSLACILDCCQFIMFTSYHP
jgi:hypothetical protein